MTEDSNDTPPASTDGSAPAPNTTDGAASSAAPEDPLAAAQAEAQRFREQLLRTAADFDNFRKRSRREMSDAERKGRDDLLKDLLPVFDNLERAVQHAQTAGAEGADWKGLSDGIDLVIRQFRDTLGRQGIERIGAQGLPFDPSVHEAIQHLETNDFSPGTIAFEVQSGYRQGERLIRPALVVVAKSPPEAASPDAGPAEPGAAANEPGAAANEPGSVAN
ncbi:MAG TPA: nucleotide exchange factor GrpE [Polyangiaceae bacterium]|nr:nucleotide exchange factor GrpE [Polyangiaceae bacterium]